MDCAPLKYPGSWPGSMAGAEAVAGREEASERANQDKRPSHALRARWTSPAILYLSSCFSPYDSINLLPPPPSLLPRPRDSRSFAAIIINDEREDPLATVRKLIPLITKSIANSNEIKSLALMNSRFELDFELRLALLELGNDPPPSQDDERLSRYVHPLLEVLGDLVREDKDHHLKAGDPHQRLRTALARACRDEAGSPELSLIRLPRTVKDLGAMAQKMASFRKANADVQSDLGLDRDCTSTHHQMTTREGSHIDKFHESDGANKHHNVRGSEPWSSRNVQDPNRSADSKVPPPPSELQQTDRTEPQRQPPYEQITAEEFIGQAQTFYNGKIRPLEKKKAIKVAVLDTGVDKGAVHFRLARRSTGQHGTSLKGVKSFVGGESHDAFGHGTRVAALIVQMAPHVDLYIAKICVGKEVIGVDQYVEVLWPAHLFNEAELTKSGNQVGNGTLSSHHQYFRLNERRRRHRGCHLKGGS